MFQPTRSTSKGAILLKKVPGTLQKLKTLLPWLVAIGILIYLFTIYPPAKIWQALQYVRLSTFIPFAVGYFILIYFADVYAMTRILKRFGFDVSLKSLLPARGATYLLMVLNYGAAQAGFAYYLKKTHRIPIWEALSIFFFIAVIDLYWIVTLALIGSFFQEYKIAGMELKNFVWGIAAAAYLLFAANYLFWRSPLLRSLEKKENRFLNWIRKKDIFRLFKEAVWTDYLHLAILRTPIHISLIISMYIVLLTFDVFVPFLHILGNMPLAFLVGTLPITPGGLGTANAVIIELLKPYLTGAMFAQAKITPAELLLAASLLWMFANYLLKVLFGAYCLKRVSKDLFKVDSKTEKNASPLGQNLLL